MHNVTEGWTEPIAYTLYADGAIYNLTGATVTLRAWDYAGNPLTLSGSVVVTSASLGQLEFRPASGDLLAANSPMKVRFRVSLGGYVFDWPNAEAETWVVRK